MLKSVVPELILSPELARACSNSTDLGTISHIRSHDRQEETRHRRIESCVSYCCHGHFFGYIE